MATASKSRKTGGIRLPWGGRLKPWRHYVRRFLLYVAVITLSALFMVPMVWMLSTSLKVQGQVFADPPVWIPNPIMWQNYIEVLAVAPLLRWLSNTGVVTVAATLGTIISSSMVGFGFARLRFPGRGALFALLLATMMLPGIVTMIPTFILFKWLNWLDTYLPLIVPSYFGGGAYNIFLVRQFYLTIPTDFDDAARIDGANNWMIWARIMLPLNAPVLTAIGIFSFVGHWNEFMGPLIYLFTEEKKTLALGLRAFVDPYLASYHLNMAGALYLTLPMVIIFFFGQRYFLKGVVMTGITGR
jgi:multiple sugar transport system permease protein